ncbi:MAG: NAD(+) synthase [Kiritimatiellae bacterium]|nr:NAD(+) synthase [Kiritimatiellia bacterium]
MNRELGYCRVGAAVPVVRPGAVSANVSSMLRCAEEAAAAGADVLVFPELSITGYTCADLFLHAALLDAAVQGLAEFLRWSVALSTLLVVGMPLRIDGLLFNCAVVCRAGRVFGIVPKAHLPNTRECYEQRWFASAGELACDSLSLLGSEVPVGGDLLFYFDDLPECGVGVEICEDLWGAFPPSTSLALQGAKIICNLSASNALAGKAVDRQSLIRQHSARCVVAYIYSNAGVGESSTDLVFAGDALICENGKVLGEGERFAREERLLVRDVDYQFLDFERRQNNVFQRSVSCVAPGRKVLCGTAGSREGVAGSGSILRQIDPHPFVPADEAQRDERCAEILAIQSSALATRLSHIGCRRVVLGLSGGIDSSLALLVAMEAFERLGLDKAGIRAITMPGFGTTERTLDNTRALAAGIGAQLEEINIEAACKQHLADIGHSGTKHDIAYENTQARERTQILMDRANMLGAMVIGTGDLSELALGWCTYNGDHMSMYAVNSGVPKTLALHLIEWAARHRVGDQAAGALTDILSTPISPELLPLDAEGESVQRTEDVIGPYELHDFFLYNFMRCGFPVAKIRALAAVAFKEVYAPEVIERWLKLFMGRFFAQQFKRSCMPDGPKVGSVNLSPRGDWRMPSDASSEIWSG